jgi:hypothetical protein
MKKKGDIITVAWLNEEIKEIYLKINHLTYLDFSNLSSGQFIKSVTASGITTESHLYNTKSEQFYDRVSAKLTYLLDDIEEIIGR